MSTGYWWKSQAELYLERAERAEMAIKQLAEDRDAWKAGAEAWQRMYADMEVLLKRSEAKWAELAERAEKGCDWLGWQERVEAVEKERDWERNRRERWRKRAQALEVQLDAQLEQSKASEPSVADDARLIAEAKDLLTFAAGCGALTNIIAEVDKAREKLELARELRDQKAKASEPSVSDVRLFRPGLLEIAHGYLGTAFRQSLPDPQRITELSMAVSRILEFLEQQQKAAP